VKTARRYAAYLLFVAVWVAFLPVAFLHALATGIMIGVYSALDSIEAIIHE
jgi:uncharacterized membrane protein